MEFLPVQDRGNCKSFVGSDRCLGSWRRFALFECSLQIINQTPCFVGDCVGLQRSCTVQVAYRRAPVCLQLVVLRQKIQSIGRTAATRSFAHRREKIRMFGLRQAIYSLRPSPETRPHSRGGDDTWRTRLNKTNTDTCRDSGECTKRQIQHGQRAAA